jgi:hypothetical protein
MVGRDYCWRVAEGGQVRDPKQGGELLSGKRLRIWGYDPSIAPSQDQTCLISHTFRKIKAASVGGLIHFEAKGSSVLLRSGSLFRLDAGLLGASIMKPSSPPWVWGLLAILAVSVIAYVTVSPLRSPTTLATSSR